MDISVVICTYNRSAFLADCIHRLARQEGMDGTSWEVVVVDNNSTDDTREVLPRLAAAHPSLALRWIVEPEQGVAWARNRGILATTSRYLAYVDDDVLPVPRWLVSIYRAFLDHDADAVGGRIHLAPEVVVPAWVNPDMRGFLGHRDFGDLPCPMDGREKFGFGANMAFHRRALEAVGLFHVGYGRRGEGFKAEELFKGEEPEYFARLADWGARMVYEPAALVHHRIRPHQLEQGFFLTVHHNAGILRARYDTRLHRRRLWGVPLFLFPQTWRGVTKYLRQLFTEGPDRAFRQKMNVGYSLGMMRGYARAARASRGGPAAAG